MEFSGHEGGVRGTPTTDRQRRPGQGCRITVIGSGFSGTMVAIHLLRRCRPGDRVYLVEQSGPFVEGPAYATTSPRHLLNVRVERMRNRLRLRLSLPLAPHTRRHAKASWRKVMEGGTAPWRELIGIAREVCRGRPRLAAVVFGPPHRAARRR